MVTDDILNIQPWLLVLLAQIFNKTYLRFIAWPNSNSEVFLTPNNISFFFSSLWLCPSQEMLQYVLLYASSVICLIFDRIIKCLVFVDRFEGCSNQKEKHLKLLMTIDRLERSLKCRFSTNTIKLQTWGDWVHFNAPGL